MRQAIRKHRKRYHTTMASLVATLLFSSAMSSTALANQEPRLNRADRDPPSRTVMYATTRLNEGRTDSPNYGIKRHLDFGPGSIDFGAARLKRPPQLYPLERAPDWNAYLNSMNDNDSKWEATPIAEPHFLEEEEFYAQIKKWSGPICLYVHGYDESFSSALRDAAIVGYELDRKNKWQSPTLQILFAWPSADKIHEYAEDEASVEWSAKPFIDFVEKLNSRKNDSSSLYLVAHSLGSRLAFALLQNEKLVQQAPIDKLVLSASDYDYFQATQRLSELEKLVKDKIYVFSSDRDGPLITSQLLHGSPRLGRPFDAPRAKTNLSAYASADAWTQLLDQAANLVLPGGLNNPPEAAMWIAKKPGIVCELGDKSRWIDVSEMVSRDAGHRLAWPLIASLLADDATLTPLATTIVYKRPDEESLRQNFGAPQHLYRFHRIVGQSYGTRTPTP